MSRAREYTPLESEHVFPCSHPECYAERVALFEAQGMTTSDAQGCADAEDLHPQLWRERIARECGA